MSLKNSDALTGKRNMKSIKNSRITTAGLLLAIPAAVFISVSILKYGFGINAPFDRVEFIFEKGGIREPIGWNINLLIVAGPLAAFLLSIFQVLKVEFHLNNEKFQLNFTFLKKWFPLCVAFFSSGLLLILFIYFIGENFNCQ
jgi:hypothetical protein